LATIASTSEQAKIAESIAAKRLVLQSHPVNLRPYHFIFRTQLGYVLVLRCTSVVHPVADSVLYWPQMTLTQLLLSRKYGFRLEGKK